MARSILQFGVYEALRHRIVTRQIPPGATLREERIAKELHVSRTPVREALRRLGEEGFVEYLPHKGARLLTPTPELMREIFTIREALEGVAARQAAATAGKDQLRMLRDHFESLRPRVAAGDLSDVGDAIHGEILQACRNARLERLMSIYRSQIAWFQAVAAEIAAARGSFDRRCNAPSWSCAC